MGVVTTETMTPTVQPNMAVEKVIVAVHGIGDQYSYATIQSVVNQFCRFYKQPAAVPLGQFHNGRPAFSIPLPYPQDKFGRLAFAEVYWASIPRGVVGEKYTLEETKKWARTIVERLRLRWQMEGWKGNCHDEDFRLTQQVLGEMIQTIAVVDRICFLADKAGLFTFDLKKLLDDYLGDVQVVAEFETHRKKILESFHDLLDKVSEAFPRAQIYFVSHSEGTVVTLLGLLQAFREKNPPAWAGRVHGLMTLGSPIDKHLALWPELFDDGPPTLSTLRDPDRRIEWRNYYDHGDPVGFELDSIRQWIQKNGWDGVFHFVKEKGHDIGFTRYPFPGKAHVDYWADEDVFDHFIKDVVERPARIPVAAPIEPPQASAELKAATPLEQPEKIPVPVDVVNNRWLSYVVPYAGVLALLFVAAYVLFRAVAEAIGYTGAAVNGITPEKLTPKVILLHTSGLAALLAGITVLARIPRLTRDLFWRGVTLGITALCAIFYLWTVRNETQASWTDLPPGTITLTLGILAALVAWLTSRKRPNWGLIPLIGAGALAMVGLVVYYLFFAENKGPLWPVFLATAGSLYLWWLAALLFDLVFIWHLYIRNSKLMGGLNKILGTYKERKNCPTPESPVAAPPQPAQV